MNIRGVRIAKTGVWVGVLGACVGSALAATPTEQKAIVQTGNGGPEVLKLQTVPVLQPADGQVLIHVYAASVNPVDWKMRAGMGGPPRGAAPGGAPGGPPGGAPPGGGAAPPPGGAMTMSAAPTQRIPGMDVAGVIVKAGSGVTDLKEGEPVFSMIGRGGGITGLNGGYSEYVVVPAGNVVAKPKNVTYAEAAGLGTAGMTGARSVDQAKVSKGQRVLITGVAGGVGSSAAQIAIARGAHVVGTASPRHADFLKSIGVTDVVDYTQGDWGAKVKDADVVIDTVGGDTALTAFNAVKKGGTFVTVASRDITPEKCAAAGVTCPASGPPGPGGTSEGDLLKEVAALVAQGKFKVHVDKSFPLAQAADAQEYNRQGHTEGKVVLTVTDQAGKK